MSVHKGSGETDIAAFLHHIWPASGVYVLASPFTIPGTTTRTYAHAVCTSIDEAARWAARWAHKTDQYFAVHTLREARVWNPNKVNRRTGEQGAYEVRTHANMAESKALFLDLDVGEGARKYATQQDAVRGLRDLCRETQLPKPTIVSSGGGIHVYWTLTAPMPSAEWRTLADLLRQVVRRHNVWADPTRTTDVASVLRVAGTWNHKREPLRPVTVLHWGEATDVSTLRQILETSLIRLGVEVPSPTTVPLGASPLSELGSNLTGDTFSGPPVSLKAVVSACTQIRRIVQLRGNVSEPEWYHALNVVRFVERGDQLIHKISDGHPDYTPEATDAKVRQLIEKQVNPTSCLKLADVAGDEGCATCVFAGKVKSPLVAARHLDQAPAPVVAAPPGTTTPPPVVPPPPAPYTRMKGGGVSMQGKTKEGDEVHTVIYPHDLYPVRRVVNSASAVEQQVWCVVLPREGAKEFILDADALYDRRKFVMTIANHGIYPVASFVQFLQDYMIAYIAELQRCVDADAQCNHLGWGDAYSHFILPTKILHADGRITPAQLSVGAARASAHVHAAGDIITQTKLLEFYKHPQYLPNQFFIMAALAAPIFYMTGHHGVIVNASGDAGASKSTTLYTAASLWGQPELYPINGTNNGATVRGRNERVTTLANLPVCVDEITHMPVKDAVDLAMSITQPGHRIRLTQEGIERHSVGSYKATMMLTTANNSLHSILSTDNAAGTAGSMRVVEVMFHVQHIHEKHEADTYWHQLKQHYGHIGEAFMRHVLQHRDVVSARVRSVMREVDQAASIQASERFWSAAIASVIVAAEIAQQLGLSSYDPQQLRAWALTVQVPHMRGVVGEAYTNPMGILAEYLEHANGDILVSTRMAGHANISNIIKAPRGQLLAHYDMETKIMWVLKKGFKDYCQRTGANSLKILDELTSPRINTAGQLTRIVKHKHIRKVLGAGTEFAKAQSWCFTIDMTHPDVTGSVDLGLITPSAPTIPLRRSAQR